MPSWQEWQSQRGVEDLQAPFSLIIIMILRYCLHHPHHHHHHNHVITPLDKNDKVRGGWKIYKRHFRWSSSSYWDIVCIILIIIITIIMSSPHLTRMTKSEEGGRSTSATFGSVVVTFLMLRWLCASRTWSSSLCWWCGWWSLCWWIRLWSWWWRW